jgi:hypothetical protein
LPESFDHASLAIASFTLLNKADGLNHYQNENQLLPGINARSRMKRIVNLQYFSDSIVILMNRNKAEARDWIRNEMHVKSTLRTTLDTRSFDFQHDGGTI